MLLAIPKEMVIKLKISSVAWICMFLVGVLESSEVEELILNILADVWLFLLLGSAL